MNVNGTLFFQADDGPNGYELWKSDGTEAGTVLVKDINLGSPSSSPNRLSNVNGTLYFSADDGSNGYELWKSDGTDAGTVLVKDINSGGGSSISNVFSQIAERFANVEGTLFFAASDGTNGSELWMSDGTKVSTVLAEDINSMSGNADGLFDSEGEWTLDALLASVTE